MFVDHYISVSFGFDFDLNSPRWFAVHVRNIDLQLKFTSIDIPKILFSGKSNICCQKSDIRKENQKMNGDIFTLFPSHFQTYVTSRAPENHEIFSLRYSEEDSIIEVKHYPLSLLSVTLLRDSLKL